MPDEVVIRLVEAHVREHGDRNGFIFKGFPRTLVQAYILDGLLRQNDASVSCILDLQVPTLELVKRLAHRGTTDRAMPYDRGAETIVHRLEEHERYARAIADYYEKTGRLHVIDGQGTPERIFARLVPHVEAAFRKAR